MNDNSTIYMTDDLLGRLEPDETIKTPLRQATLTLSRSDNSQEIRGQINFYTSSEDEIRFSLDISNRDLEVVLKGIPVGYEKFKLTYDDVTITEHTKPFELSLHPGYQEFGSQLSVAKRNST